MPLPNVDYGEIKGSVVISGQPVERDLVAVTYALQDTGEVDGGGDPILARKVVGDARSLADGTYVMAMAGFFDEAIIIALPDYGIIWKPNWSHSVGDRIRPTTGNETGYIYECTIAGVSNATEPTWWIDDGGTNTGAVGAATFKAVESWWPVAHAPIVPTYVSAATTLYPLEIDPFGGDVKINLHFDGGFTNSAVGGPVATTAGTPTTKTLQSKFGGESYQPDSSDDRVLFVDDSVLDVSGTGVDFTFELWVYRPSAVTSGRLFDRGSETGSTYPQYSLTVSSGSLVHVVGSGTASPTPLTVLDFGAIAADQWVHVAWSRNNGNDYFFIGGALASSRTAINIPSLAGGKELCVGNYPNGAGEHFAGYIDDFRFTYGVGRYTEGYAPPIEPSPDSRFAVGREPTILDAYFSDIAVLIHGGGSHNTTDITTEVIGVAVTSVGSPFPTYFNTLTKYSSTSILFNGGVLDMPFDMSAPFTIEGLFYFNVTAGTFIDNRISVGVNLALYGDMASGLKLYVNSANRIATAFPAGNTWVHLAITYDGATFELFVGGVSAGTYAAAYSFTSTDIRFGNNYVNSDQSDLYIEEIRLTNAVRYTGNFTPAIAAHPDFEYDPLEDLNA